MGLKLNQARRLLQETFGFSNFREPQEEIITHLMEGGDALALMPTGGGKSLCYQLPALLFDGLTIVISPLIALMKDQVDALRLNGVEAVFLNSSLSTGEQRNIIRGLDAGRYKLLYLAPERLFSDDGYFLQVLKTWNVSLLAIDEAHCISHWGHDFRPEYLNLARLKETFPETPVIALTATADEITRKDILEKLNLPNAKRFISSFNRANIHYYIEPGKRGKMQKLTALIDRYHRDSGIIYCLSRKSTEKLAEELRVLGYRALPYHAGLEQEERTTTQEKFLKDEIQIVCATIAFGMGIDKSNVRYVAHVDLPKNIESYYQETGRAGRDGLKSEALLFFSYGDVMKLRQFALVEDNEAQTKIMLRKLDQMAEFCQARQCRRQYLLRYFGEEHPGNCNSCDYCLSQRDEIDGTVIAQKLLSAIARLGENYGITHIIRFLVGSKDKRISLDQRKIKTYGAGADIDKQSWRQYIKQLLHQELLEQHGIDYPVLKLNDQSWEVLRGKRKVTLERVHQPQRKKAAEPDKDYNRELFEELRAKRKQIADKLNLPAFVVLHDTSLVDLATYLPHSEEDLALMSGFGKTKIQKYGSDFLAIVRSFCTRHGERSRMHRHPSIQQKRVISSGENTYTETFELYQKGLTIEEIARQRGYAPSTIHRHLDRFVAQGKIPLDDLVPAKKIPIIKDVLKANPGERLGILKEQLPEDFTYEEIRTVQTAMAQQNVQAG